MVDMPQSMIPNLITANGDGKNEAFVVPFPEEISKIEIFDRWGKALFVKEGYENDWLPDKIHEGTCFFHLTYTNGQGCHGWLQIIK